MVKEIARDIFSMFPAEILKRYKVDEVIESENKEEVLKAVKYLASELVRTAELKAGRSEDEQLKAEFLNVYEHPNDLGIDANAIDVYLAETRMKQKYRGTQK